MEAQALRLNPCRTAVLTRHLWGGRIEDACGEVTGHPYDELRAVILVGLVRSLVAPLFSWEVGYCRPIGGRHLVSCWGSAGVICALLCLEVCHKWVERGHVEARHADGCARKPEIHTSPMGFAVSENCRRHP